MPAGQWVAFDVSTEEAHICGIQNKPDVSVKIKGKKKKKFELQFEVLNALSAPSSHPIVRIQVSPKT